MARKKAISSGFGLFTPNKVQGLTENRASIVNVTASQNTGSISTHVSSSYRYDDPGNPLKSTQQLNIDWNNFENHTFFNSAEAKVNMAFETIINNYPFDGTVGEIFNFEDSLTGFEKHVLESIPHYAGFLNFNQSENITVADRAGTLYPSLSRDTTAQAILDPGIGPFAYEMYVYIPVNRGGNEADKKQVIAQKIKTNNGITLYTEPTPTVGDSDSETAGSQDSLTHSDIVLMATSGSVSASGRVSIKRGKWTHISACLNRTPGINSIEMFVDGKLKSRSKPFEIFDFAFKDQSMIIGSGSNITASGDIPAVTFATAFSGSIDDFRVFHSARSETALDSEKDRKVEPRKSLRVNFAFNEPTGSYNNQAVVLDHSGNSLHSKITNYVEASRIDSGYGNPMSYEDPFRFPVLFPSHPDLVSYNSDLMVSASNYDTNNPNMITKLVPEHYLREAHFNEGFDDKKELGDSEDDYGYDNDFPGGGKMGSPQIIAALLFIWAKQFDEMKLYLDQFGKLLHADYRDEDTIADTFLPFMAEYFGFELPDMFPNSSQGQFVGREGQGTDQALAKLSLQKIQNTIWRRVLSDIREIMRSKGTIHGIKTFLRNVGIDPDRNFRFREYGGSRTGRIGASRQEVKEIGRMLSFADALATTAPGALTGSLPLIVKNRTPGSKTVFTRPVDAYKATPLIVSPFLSGTRTEPGAPLPQVASSNFLLANSSSYSDPKAPVATITIADGNAVHGMLANQNITITDFAGKKVKYFISDTSDGGVAHKGIVNNGATLKSTGAITATVAAGETGCAIGFNVGQALPGGIDQGEFLLLLKQSIESINGHNGNITATTSQIPEDGPSSDGSQTIELRQNKNIILDDASIVEDIANLTATNFSKGSEGEKIVRSGEHVKFGVSPEPSDGLFTSGSWTCESMYIYGGFHTAGLTQPVTQSLMRMYVTGTVMQKVLDGEGEVIVAASDPAVLTKETAKAKITFNDQPDDGSKITLVDNNTPTTKTFQFDTVAKITIKITATSADLGNDVEAKRITINPDGAGAKTYTFTTGTELTGTTDKSSTNLVYTGQPTANNEITLISTDTTSKTYIAKGSGTSGNLDSGKVIFVIGANADATYTNFVTAVNHANGHNAGTPNSKITLTHQNAGDANNAGNVVLEQTVPGKAGDTNVVETLAGATCNNFSGGVDVRVKTSDGPNGIATFNHIAEQLVIAINGTTGHSGVLTATREGNVVSIEPNGMVAPVITITDTTYVDKNTTTNTAPDIRVPISPRGVEYTTQNLVTQIKSQAALKITPTLLGTSKSIRLTMDNAGTPGTPKIVSTGTTNSETTHFLGGFNDELLSFDGSISPAFDGTNGQTGRTMVTNLIALSGSDDLQTTGSLVLFARPIPNRAPLVMALTGTDVFDGDRWNICFGRIRNDLTGTHVSSSYFLQASKAMGDRLVISNRVEKLFDDHQPSLASGDTEIKLVSPSNPDTITITSDDAVTKVYKFVSAPAVGSVTITNHANLTAGNTVAFQTSAGTTITATAHASVTTTTDTNSPTFDIGDGSNNATASNLATCLNANSAIKASASGAVVTITQLILGSSGNKTITLTDPGPAGMSKVDIAGGVDGAATGTAADGATHVNTSGKATISLQAKELKAAILSSLGHGSNVKAQGKIVVPLRNNISEVNTLKTSMDTDTFTLVDTEGNSQKFTFRTSTDQTTLGVVGIKSDTTVEGIANSIRSSINSAPSLKITASAPAITSGSGDNAEYTVTLTQDIAGSSGNTSISDQGAASPVITYSNLGDVTSGTTAKFSVVVEDDTVILSQESKIPVSVATSDAVAIVFPKKLSATHMPVFSNITNINRSGSFLMVGEIDDSATAGKTYGLDCVASSLQTAIGSDGEHNVNQAAMAQSTKFGGNIGQIRFWSKALTEKEHQEHSLNFKSTGVENPAKNYNFVNNLDGAFEKLRLDVSVDQDVTGSDGLGTILLKDYSQQMFDMEGYAFGDKKQQIYPKTFKYSIMSPNFDQSSQSNKVRVRSYKDPAVARRELVDVAPVYHIPKSEKIHDDLRFGIEISIAQALNEDIVNIMATMDEIENALGAPESQFDVGYQGLENIREVYFNRLTDKINMSNFFQFFRWFDNTIGGTIEGLVPRKTKFTGVNYIIEPHLLERPKFTYNTSDMYLGENNRHGLKGEILLRQLVALVRRF